MTQEEYAKRVASINSLYADLISNTSKCLCKMASKTKGFPKSMGAKLGVSCAMMKSGEHIESRCMVLIAREIAFEYSLENSPGSHGEISLIMSAFERLLSYYADHVNSVNNLTAELNDQLIGPISSSDGDEEVNS